MEQLVFETHNKAKAEKIIDLGFISHRMHWKRCYSSINDRYTYVIWYTPVKVTVDQVKPSPF